MRLRHFLPVALGSGALVAALLATAGGGTTSGGPSRPAATRPVETIAVHPLGGGRDLGPVGPSTPLRLDLALSTPNRAELDRLINSGHTVAPDVYAREFLPPRSAVEKLVADLDRSGLRAAWTPGTAMVAVTTTAAAAERYFSVRIDRFREANGRLDYAAAGQPDLRRFDGLVTAVAGLDNRTRTQTGSVGHPAHPARPARALSSGRVADSSGCAPADTSVYSPSQIASAYNFASLAAKGLKGTDQTVVFLEIDTFDQSDLDCFTSQYNESPISVSVAPQNWGTPDDSDHGEADLDLEIVHSLAPEAHLVVYYSDAPIADTAAAAQAAITAYPHAIFSVSLGHCEYGGSQSGSVPADQTVMHNALTQLASGGGTMFVSSGDSGAYTCGSDVTDQSGNVVPTVSYPASDPLVTSVGGTALFLSGSGSYGSEATWGNPFEASGGGGGLSAFWKEPDWQSSADNKYSDGSRQVPDVSALGDPHTGWEIYSNGGWEPTGGTSAAAPLWAALGALADQDLAAKQLPPLGFANPMLYSFGQAPSSQPSQPFFDVTSGNNLYYPA
ncbi:MAG TPA: S53 family peptidase, partial [Acidimicrobiales bacterium]|nr:S53 family peptidase [Acidimicrobiales bacterium]